MISLIPEEELVRRGKAEEEKTRRFEMWAPSVVRTGELSHALKWLMENLPEAPTSVEVLVDRAVEEENIERAAVESAIGRLIQQEDSTSLNPQLCRYSDFLFFSVLEV